MVDYDADLIAQMQEQYPYADKQTMQQILEFFSKKIEDIQRERSERVSFKPDEIYPEDLKPHPINTGLYDGLLNADDSLVDSILQRGLLEPLIINSKREILSGHRRWLALLKINTDKKIPKRDDGIYYSEDIFTRWKARCFIATFQNDQEERLAIIEYNKRRPKRASQLYNEIEILNGVYRTKFYNHTDRENVREMKQRVLRSEKADSWDSSLKDVENISKLRHFVETDEERYDQYFRENESIIQQNIVDALGISPSNLRELRAIGNAAKRDNTSAKQIMLILDSNKLTIHGAYILFWLSQQENEDAVALTQRAVAYALKKNEDKLTPTMAMKEYRKLYPKPPKVSKRSIITDASGNRITKAEAKNKKITVTPYKPLTDEQKAEIDRKHSEEMSKRIAENDKKWQEFDSNPPSPAARGDRKSVV